LVQRTDRESDHAPQACQTADIRPRQNRFASSRTNRR
jgi:hypothetical protein